MRYVNTLRHGFILLTIVPQTIAASPNSLLDASSHLDGAIALLRLRGKEQLDYEISSKLFISIRTQMVSLLEFHFSGRLTQRTQVSNFSLRSKVYEDFPTDWTEKISTRTSTNRLTEITKQIPSFRIAANELLNGPRNEETIMKMAQLVDDMTGFEARITAWAGEVIKSWPRELSLDSDGSSQADSKQVETLPQHRDNQCDLWVSSMWNSYRCGRLFVHGMLLKCIESWSDPETHRWSVNRSNSLRIIQEMVDEICVSIPYHLGHNESQGLSNTSDKSLPSVPCGDEFDQSSKALGGYLIMWHLFLAASMECISDQQRKWIREQLMYIGNGLGIKQAALLSSVSIARICGTYAIFG